MIRHQHASGFTIVELLIVVVIIAILAVITIATFNGLQARARASQVSTALNQAGKKLEVYKVDNSAYPTTGNLANAGINNSDVTYQYTSDGSSYCVTATAGNVSYYLNSTTASSPTTGGCPGHGQGGVAAVTNLALGPRGTVYNTANGPTFLNDRYGGANGTYSLLTGQTPPSGTDITTAVRYTVLVSGNGRGFHISGNPEAGTPGGYISRFPVSAGEVYTISCWVRVSQAGFSFVVRTRPAIDTLTWLDSGATGTSTATTAGAWTRVSQTYTVPAGATALESYVIATTAVGVNGTIDATGLMVTKGSTLYNYADGNSTNWVWNGATNLSTSTGPAQ